MLLYFSSLSLFEQTSWLAFIIRMFNMSLFAGHEKSETYLTYKKLNDTCSAKVAQLLPYLIPAGIMILNMIGIYMQHLLLNLVWIEQNTLAQLLWFLTTLRSFQNRKLIFTEIKGWLLGMTLVDLWLSIVAMNLLFIQ